MENASALHLQFPVSVRFIVGGLPLGLINLIGNASGKNSDNEGGLDPRRFR
jgi:hypothetical protein